MSRFAAAILVLGFASCDRNGSDILPQYKSDVPAVLELGTVRVLTLEELDEFSNIGSHQGRVDWCAEEIDGTPRCIYDVIGAPGVGVRGGATFNFYGTGGDVCLLVDPETVFWSQSVSKTDPQEEWIYPDYVNDDGDLDLYAGMSAYYNGSPGVEIGDFEGIYTDSLGREVEIEYGACTQDGSSLSGIDYAHAGRGTVEYCTVSTDQREDIQYTAVLDTFSIPMDDGVLAFGAMVVGATCGTISSGPGDGGINLPVDECLIKGESLESDLSPRDCTWQLETAYCADSLSGDFEDFSPLQAFCCTHEDMCGPYAPVDVCDEFDAAAFCSAYPNMCCN